MVKPKKRRSPMGRPRKKPETDTYRGRVAARLSALLDSEGLTLEEAARRLSEACGETIEPATLAHWAANRRPLPIEMLAPIAKVFGFRAVPDWLPKR